MASNKMMILNGVGNKEYNGVLKIYSDGDCYVKMNLNIPKNEIYTLVLKSDRIVAYNVNLQAEALKIDDIDLNRDIYAVVAIKDKGILYGGTGGDKIKAFSLLSEFRSLLDSSEFFIREAVEYIPKFIEMTDKIIAENPVENESDEKKMADEENVGEKTAKKEKSMNRDIESELRKDNNLNEKDMKSDYENKQNFDKNSKYDRNREKLKSDNYMNDTYNGKFENEKNKQTEKFENETTPAYGDRNNSGSIYNKDKNNINGKSGKTADNGEIGMKDENDDNQYGNMTNDVIMPRNDMSKSTESVDNDICYDEKLKKEVRDKMKCSEKYKETVKDAQNAVDRNSGIRTDEEILEEIRRKEKEHNSNIKNNFEATTLCKDEEITEEKEEVKEQCAEEQSVETKSTKKQNKNAEAFDEEAQYFDENLIYKGDNFYMAIHSQIDEIFVCYPEEPSLKALIPDSNWVKVEYAKNEYYVVGIIKENDEVKYICYGVPSRYDVKPPVEVKDIAKWLPLDINEPRGKGYWLIYQDGKNGKTLTDI